MPSPAFSPPAKRGAARVSRALGLLALLAGVAIPSADALADQRRRIAVPDDASVGFLTQALEASRQAADAPILESGISVEPAELSLDVRIQFAFDSAEILPGSAQLLANLARAMAASGATGGGFRVEGHTDSTGTDAYNLGLSWRRARAVIGFLADRGTAGARLDPLGYGEQRPNADYPSDDPRQRRVEILAIR